jgi:hypothetical protein
MGIRGRPSTKRQPHRPGATVPVLAAGCGPERHVAVIQPKRPKPPPLKLTNNGWVPDWLGIWHGRKKKGSQDTVIDDAQYLAGRRLEHLMNVIAYADRLRSPDLTTPVVDTSFTHRLGGYSAEQWKAAKEIARIRKHLGARDFKFLTNALFEMGPEGALLAEAGLEWKYTPLDRDEGLISGAAGILAKGGAYNVVANFADAHREIGGGIAVEDRQSLQALGKAGKIDTKNDLSITKAEMRAELERIVTVHLEGGQRSIEGQTIPLIGETTQDVARRQSFDVVERAGVINLAGMGKVPHDLGFIEDEATVIENTTKRAARNRVLENKVDIALEDRRDELEKLRGLKDPESRARREELEAEEAADDIFAVMEVSERAMRDCNPDEDKTDIRAAAQAARMLPGSKEYVRDADNSAGRTIEFNDVEQYLWTTRERAIEKFKMRGVELGRKRVRDLLTALAKLPPAPPADCPAFELEQITQSSGIPFDVGIKDYVDAVYEEIV